MFKKLKDKLAEEVKNSPQKIQQIAQAAQAAVTSASSSISDITNHDLFSIGDSDSRQSVSAGSPEQNRDLFQDVTLLQPTSSHKNVNISRDGTPTNEIVEMHRQRKLSNSSFASDVSFKLPMYDSPTMYHMQSDMEVSASEAEDRGLPSSGMSLERVTKEQLYGAYRRTQERYSKYRTRYADLARHYKFLERENAKARSVLVETQDKALRRISELREQCSLEQSAKAHLESALRVEIDEKNTKIDSLNTKIKLLNNSDDIQTNENEDNHETQLLDLSIDSFKPDSEVEIIALKDKIQKMEHLVSKYKESLKNYKEKNAQLTGEISVLSNDLKKNVEENEQLQIGIRQLTEARQQIQELKEHSEELQNKLNGLEFNKAKEISSLEMDIKLYQDEISNLQSKINVFTKREEEYAISLAENKLSIHKELEEKEAEIKSLKNSLSASKNEVKSLEIVLEDYKQTIAKFEEESSNLKNKISNLNSANSKLSEMEDQIQQLKQKCMTLEIAKAQSVEKLNCFELQLKQETAEKLAFIDRNNYLQTRNNQMLEESTKKSKQLSELEKSFNDLQKAYINNDTICGDNENNFEINTPLATELETWKEKYFVLESEIQEERIELVKLQSEIEKLLANHELSQAQNMKLNALVSELQSEVSKLREEKIKYINLANTCEKLKVITRNLKKNLSDISKEVDAKQNDFLNEFQSMFIPEINKTINDYLNKTINNLEKENKLEMDVTKTELESITKLHSIILNEVNTLRNTSREQESKIKLYEEKIKEIEDSNTNLLTENKLLEERSSKIMENMKYLEYELNEVRTTHRELEKEKSNLMEKIKEIEKEEIVKHQAVQIVNEKNKELENKLETLNNDLDNFTSEISRLQSKILQNENELNNKETEINRYKEEINHSKQTLKTILDENELLHDKCERLKQEKEEFHEKTLIIEQKVTEYERKIEEQQRQLIEMKNHNINIMQLSNDLGSIKTENDRLNEMNANLSIKLADFTSETNKVIEKLHLSVTQLESELEDEKNKNETIRSKCFNYETENKLLQENLEQLQNSSKEEKSHMETIIQNLKNDFLLQSETMSKIEVSADNLPFPNPELTNESEGLQRNETNYSEEIAKSSAENIQKNTELNNVEAKYSDLLNIYETVREDNKRLTSDIEGLRAHLNKVSKDNGQLNDKLREVIANSESLPPNDNRQLYDITEVTGKIKQLEFTCQRQLEKIEDLERQNSILAEENLELQDQSNLQSSSKDKFNKEKISTDKELEFQRLKNKHNIILEQKNQLQKILTDLEYTNSSGVKNMQHLEEKNEKLKLSNEKLERRLDEALVSLRHLRALEENTELEYLRNILYEYLTGTGAHSVTLAKVLSAVVKFDDRQTQMVLQREKERQGLLRQLGLL